MPKTAEGVAQFGRALALRRQRTQVQILPPSQMAPGFLPGGLSRAKMTLMIAKILYNKNSESQSPAENFAKSLDDLKVNNELVDADSRDGAALAELYDLLSRPAVILLRDDGSVVERWQHSLPLATDVSYLAHQ